ncbi:MAG: diguanylate cyclase, partial [bacterium]
GYLLMNYEAMECLSEGIIIKQTRTNKVIYTNTAMKCMLNIPPEVFISDMYEITYSYEMFNAITEKVAIDLETQDIVKGVTYFKQRCEDDKEHIVETTFKCKYIDKENNIVIYAFDEDTKVVSSLDNIHLVNLIEVPEFIPNGVMVMSIEPELSVAYANEEQYKILEIDKTKEEFNNLLKYSIYEEDRDWVMSEIYDNLYHNKNVDVEFRMKGKRNSIKWVRLYGRARTSSNGERLFYSTLKDLSDRREINDKLHLERVLFHKITEISDELIFRLDLRTNIIHFMGKGAGMFDDTSMENFPQCFLDAEMIFEEDIHLFLEFVESMKDGTHKYIEMRYRANNAEEMEWQWHKPIYTFVKDSEGEPLLVIGKLVNINDQKILQEQAKRDLLTGFYNKISTEIEINELISSNKASKSNNEHAMFIIDLDHFKEINDNLGHHFGDFVLKEVATDIKDCFRKDDIFGRIGGDEFIVVMKNCNDIDIALEKAGQLCNVLQKPYHSETSNHAISASIGVALCPEDGTTFESLYKKADKALYYSKKNGRNRFAKYNDNFTQNTVKLTTNNNQATHRKYELIDFEVIREISDLLHETENKPEAVKKALEYLTIYYKVDRGYLYEIDSNINKDAYINTYLWEKEHIEIPTQAKNVSIEVFENIFHKSSKEGIFYTNDVLVIEHATTAKILENDNISSIFLIKSDARKKQKMFFGLDDCTRKRIWGKREIKTLHHVVRLIFDTLMDYNTIQNLKVLNQKLKDL